MGKMYQLLKQVLVVTIKNGLFVLKMSTTILKWSHVIAHCNYKMY